MGDNFNGVIEEIPGIKVDNFTTGCRTYFLTHAHSDHMQGLDNKMFTGLICATEATRRVVINTEVRDSKTLSRKKYQHLQTGNWQILLIGQRTAVNNYDGLYVTAIDANHCPGSAMFLLEVGQIAVLCTGDVRAEPWFVNSLVRNPVLYKYTVGKSLDAIYADTNFAYRLNKWDDPRFLEIPDNYESTEQMLKLVRRYPKETVFCSNITTIGFEPVICQLSLFLEATFGNGKIHMGPYYSRLYQSLAKHNAHAKIISDNLVTDGKRAKIHLCRKLDHCPSFDHKMRCYLMPKIRLSQEHMMFLNNPDHDKAILMAVDEADQASRLSSEDVDNGDDDDCTAESSFSSDQGDRVTKLNRAFFRGRDSDQLVPRGLLYQFSRHSSYSEIHNLVGVFRPKQVYPIWHNERAFQRGFIMKRLFGDVCSTGKFRYDEEMRVKHENAYKNLVRVPVETTWHPSATKIFIGYAPPKQEDTEVNDHGSPTGRDGPADDDTESESELELSSKAGPPRQLETAQFSSSSTATNSSPPTPSRTSAKRQLSQLSEHENNIIALPQSKYKRAADRTPTPAAEQSSFEVTAVNQLDSDIDIK